MNIDFLKKRHDIVKCSRDVLKALETGLPLVALETSIISHGMPFPQSLELAKELEKIIRDEGAQPATLAILDGKIQIGLDPEVLDAFAKTKNVEKVSSSNFESTLFSKKTGGTTVSGSLKICKIMSIQTFVTGGIGGVHRNFTESLDISSDLNSIKESNVITVCSGPKSILDISKTYELLETLSVPVFSYQQKNLPAFWYRDSGIKSGYIIESPKVMAEIFSLMTELGKNTGLLLCNPLPKKYSLEPTRLESFIADGLLELKRNNIDGKKVTPSLLQYLVKKTKGKTLKSNIELVKSNAILGAKIAKALSETVNRKK
ncbi:pseudouridine-5'-phosphate glycosidase [Paracoccaceae bacterium]|nr:pseudouridine-5'-phosphate glycosidase [Paracoccaceae bacterium]